MFSTHRIQDWPILSRDRPSRAEAGVRAGESREVERVWAGSPVYPPIGLRLVKSQRAPPLPSNREDWAGYPARRVLSPGSERASGRAWRAWRAAEWAELGLGIWDAATELVCGS